MRVTRAVRQILAELPPAMLVQLADVAVEHRPHPNAVDVARGATPEHRAYFFGHDVDRDPTSTALPDEARPRGVVVLFTALLQPLTPELLAKILLHELGHALGYDHDVLEDELCLK